MGPSLDAADACRTLDEIGAMPPRWPVWGRVAGVALFAAGFAPSVVATWNEVATSALLGLVMGVLVVATAGRALEGLLPFFGAFVLTVLALTVLQDLSYQAGVTLVALPALFIVVPGDTLSAAAGELLSGRLTTGAIRMIVGFFTLGLIVIGVVAAAGVTGHTDALAESLPPPELPYAVVLAGWAVFCLGLALALNAEPSELVWLVPSVLATFLLQQGATRIAGAVVGTLVAGVALGAHANVIGVSRGRPPRLILVLGGFFVLTVGGVGVRGATALFGGDIVSGLQDLADFALQVPTVAIAIAVGVFTSDLVRNRRAGARFA